VQKGRNYSRFPMSHEGHEGTTVRSKKKLFHFVTFEPSWQTIEEHYLYRYERAKKLATDDGRQLPPSSVSYL
jgi:hypothetical protein